MKFEFQAAVADAFQPLQRPTSPRRAPLPDPPEELPLLNIGRAYKGDGFSFTVMDATVERAAQFTDKYTGKATTSVDPLLLLHFQIVNSDERQVLTFFKGRIGHSPFRLVDDVENRVLLKRSDELDGNIGTARIKPGEFANTVYAFDVPLPKTKYCIVTVDLSCLGSDGKVQFKIPISKIRGFNNT